MERGGFKLSTFKQISWSYRGQWVRLRFCEQICLQVECSKSWPYYFHLQDFPYLVTKARSNSCAFAPLLVL